MNLSTDAVSSFSYQDVPNPLYRNSRIMFSQNTADGWKVTHIAKGPTSYGQISGMAMLDMAIRF